MSSDLIANLNEQQKAAVTLPEVSSLILAGAGSGKTSVLISRIAFPLEHRLCTPAELFAVTFTNKAAREMMTRLQAKMPLNTRAMWVGTFHGLCNRMLRLHHEAAGLPAAFAILDMSDQLGAIKRIMKANNINEEVLPARKIQNYINKQNPDVVVFTGDLYDNYAKYHDDEHIIKELQKINATYDKIAIWGNRDCGGGAARQYENIMEQSGFTVLKNENWYVTTDSDKKILFTGLDDSMLGNVYMPDSTKIYDSNYNILLIHEPDTADSFQEYPYDLVLSGPIHGGQVNIPFIPAINQKAISSTNLAKNYVSGMYELNSKTKIYVNTGIGTTHVSGRLGVVPEISIFHIYL